MCLSQNPSAFLICLPWALQNQLDSIMAGIIGEAKIQAVVPAGFFHDV
jgi:hypothetical protein